MRTLEQAGIAPDIARLSDESETELSVALAGTGGLARRLIAGRCLLICGWEGATGRAAAARALVRGGARPLGPKPGRAWERSRFAGPHLRDDLMDHGVLVETLETATSWSNLETLYGAVRGALAGFHVGCHVSHLYPSGASLYFTVLGAQAEDPFAQWEGVKDTVTRAIVAAGGTITHHHAIGRDHAPYLPAEVGDLGIELLRAVKERCDPAGIMNPGKLVDFAAARLS